VPGAPSHHLLLLLLVLLQGEGAAGWTSDHLIVAEALVNSLAEKFSAPLQVGGGSPGWGKAGEGGAAVGELHSMTCVLGYRGAPCAA
jgi:hypothetical protein